MRLCGPCVGWTREAIQNDVTCRLGYCNKCFKYGPFVVTLPNPDYVTTGDVENLVHRGAGK